MAAKQPEAAVQQNPPVASAEDANHEKLADLKGDQDEDPAPDGGARAWLAAAGGGAIFFSTLGFANSFGTFEEFYVSQQLRGNSPSKIAWIGSLSIALQFMVGIIAGPLFDRFGSKVVAPSAILYIFAIMMLSLCKTYWQVMLVQGVLMGTIMGLLQLPAFAACSQYFDKKRAAALGIVVAGSSVGGIVIPIALSKMLNGTNLGFGWSVRILGFMVMPFLFLACLTVKPRLPPRRTQFWLFEAYKNPKFIVLIVAFFFMICGMFTPFFYLPSYAVTRGMGPLLAGYLLAFLNAASVFGRVIPAILADKYGRINMFALGGLMTGIVIFCMSSATSNASLIVYSIFIGFTSGTIISGGSAALSICPPNPRDVGTYMGMGMAFAGVGGLVGPPINGAIVNAYGGFFEVSMFSGSLTTFGGLIALAAKFWTPGGLFSIG